MEAVAIALRAALATASPAQLRALRAAMEEWRVTYHVSYGRMIRFGFARALWLAMKEATDFTAGD